MRILIQISIILITAALLVTAADIQPTRLSSFGALPEVMKSPRNEITPEKVALGKLLYFENRISKSHQFSCNSCHKLDKFGVDNEPTSPGHKGQRGDRNSPTVYNAAGHFVQFWDGRAADVEEQAKGPVLNPVEMAMPGEKQVVDTLKSIPGYAPLFRKAFPGDPDPITYDHFAMAVGAFERTLVTPSKWDKFLKGDKAALTDAEKAGFNKFYEVGCATCHYGTYLGGNTYQKLGLAKPWPAPKDLGRYDVTKSESDKLMFKTPSLRNIEKTGPFFHDGKVATLEEAIKEMAEHQVNKAVTDADVASIVTFLKTLTGAVPPDALKPPRLPAAGAKTPKPDLSE